MFLPTLLLWYVKASVMIVREVKIHATQVRKSRGIGYLKQLIGMSYLAFIKNASPDLYYYLRLYENKISIGENYLTNEHFFPVLSYLIHGKNYDLLTDKFKFWQLLKPVIPEVVDIIAVIRDGQIYFTNQSGDLPETDLFVKPLDGHGGLGCQKITYHQNGLYTTGSTGIKYDKANLILLLKQQAINNTYILQPFLQNRDEINRLTNGNLATCRITTYKDSRQGIDVLFAIFMMPVDDSVTSNTNGIHSLVDLKTGVLSPARNMSDPFYPIEYHPQGGGKISGTTLPNWAEAQKLCRNAHRILNEFPIIGWDIAFTTNGVILVEGNLIWPAGFWSALHFDEQECLRFVKIIEGFVKGKLSEGD